MILLNGRSGLLCKNNKSVFAVVRFSKAAEIKQIAVAASLGLHRIGDVTEQPDNNATKGKIAKLSHLIEVTEA